MVGIKLSYCVAKRNLIKGEQKGFITWQRGCYSQLLVQPPSIALRLLPQLLLVPGARCVAPCSLKAAPCIAWLHAPLVVPLSRSPAPPAAPPAAPTSIPPQHPSSLPTTGNRAHPSTGGSVSPLATSSPARSPSACPLDVPRGIFVCAEFSIMGSFFINYV